MKIKKYLNEDIISNLIQREMSGTDFQTWSDNDNESSIIDRIKDGDFEGDVCECYSRQLGMDMSAFVSSYQRVSVHINIALYRGPDSNFENGWETYIEEYRRPVEMDCTKPGFINKLLLKVIRYMKELSNQGVVGTPNEN